jgi:hypothetical protein
LLRDIVTETDDVVSSVGDPRETVAAVDFDMAYSVGAIVDCVQAGDDGVTLSDACCDIGDVVDDL